MANQLTNNVPEWLICVYFIGLYGLEGIKKAQHIESEYMINQCSLPEIMQYLNGTGCEKSNHSPVHKALEFYETYRGKNGNLKV